MKNGGTKTPLANAASPRGKATGDALKIVQALQNFVADSEELPGLSEVDLAALAQALKEEMAKESSYKTAKSWAKRLLRYTAVEDSKQTREFFEQFALSVQRESARRAARLIERSGRSSTRTQQT